MNDNNNNVIQFENNLNPNSNNQNSKLSQFSNEINNNVQQEQKISQNNIQSNVTNNDYIQPINTMNTNSNQGTQNINPATEQYSNDNNQGIQSNPINNNLDNNTNKKKNNKKIIIIVCVILGIVLLCFFSSFVLSFTQINSTIDKARESSFKSEAESILEAARNNINSDDLISVIDKKQSKYNLYCDGENEKQVKLKLTELQNAISKSPFGNNYDVNNSYVKVVAKTENNICRYIYSIYLTDGTYSIGSPNNPVDWNAIKTTNIIKK